MKTEINKINADWIDVKNACRTTIGKDPTNNIPNSEFKSKLLISEHSPIRLITVRFRWKAIKSWIATHFARHWLGWNKFISTQRNDRTEGNIDRNKAPQDTLVSMDVEGNAQALINVGRFRLCRQSSDETREHMEDLKISIGNAGETELSNVIVPNCIYRFGCPEFTPCNFFGAFLKYCKDNNITINTIQQRYDAYNKYFYSIHNCDDKEN